MPGGCFSSVGSSSRSEPRQSEVPEPQVSNAKRAVHYQAGTTDAPTSSAKKDPLSPKHFRNKSKGKHKRGASTYDLVKGFDPQTGAKTLNQYVRVAKIGEGSYGKVSLFRNAHDGRYYAIKVLNRELLQRKRVAPGVTALEDVMREVRILKQLQHAHLVRVLETINDPMSPKMYLIMDYLAGGTILTPPRIDALPSPAPDPAPSAPGPPALAKIRSHTHLPLPPRPATSTNTPTEGSSPRGPARHTATRSVESFLPIAAPSAAAHSRLGSAGGVPAALALVSASLDDPSPHTGGIGSTDSAGSLLHSVGLGRRVHRQWGSSHNLPGPESPTGAPAAGVEGFLGAGQGIYRGMASRKQSHAELNGLTSDSIAVTLNFGGVSLAADAGVSAQRMVEPEIADDGILLPPFGPLPEDVIRKRLIGVLEGLAFLHAHGVAHGDIKPQNLLLTVEGVVKLADLSCSVEFDVRDPRGAYTTRAPGTPLFTAPECCSEDPFDATAADVWSVGVTAYAMAYGRVPFFAPSPYEIYEQICASAVVWPAFPHVSPGLRSLIAAMLDKNAKARPRASELLAHPFLAGVTQTDPVPPRHPKHPTMNILARVSERFYEPNVDGGSVPLSPQGGLNLAMTPGGGKRGSGGEDGGNSNFKEAAENSKQSAGTVG